MPEDVRGSTNGSAPIQTPDCDTFDLDWRACPRVDDSLALGYILKHSPILSLPVRVKSQSRLDETPECTMRDAVAPRLLP